jgi:small subunit ribosomal protein S15
MEKEKKQTVIEGYRTHEGDTGSPQVQVALLTERINSLTEHMKVHRHDYHSLRGLMMMVGQRQRLLKYLVKKDPESYRTTIKKLGIRK